MRTRVLAAAGAMLLASSITSAAPQPGQGTWETTLQPRDLDHNGVVDAYYDTQLNLTWLADTKLIATSGVDADGDGEVNWDRATDWAASLSLGGVTGWRLPDVKDSVSVEGSRDPKPNPNLDDSPLMHLSYATLGNTNVSFAIQRPFNTGPFQNIGGLGSLYWTSGVFISGCGCDDDPYGWVFLLSPYNSDLVTTIPHLAGEYGAWAIHDGDVAAIPEPATCTLLVAGLMAFGVREARRRRNGDRRRR